MTTTALSWSELVEYERDEVVLHIMRIVTHPLFRRDALCLIEREDTRTSRGTPAEHVRALLLCGHVGVARLPALLTLLRRLRLHHVSDLGSAVTCGCVAGDAVPHVLLTSLDDTCAHARCLHRWQLVRQAMRCGMLHRIGRRRRVLQQRLAHLLQQQQQGHGQEQSRHGDDTDSGDDDNAYMQQLLDRDDDEGMTTTALPPQPPHPHAPPHRRRRFAPFSTYHAVLTDKRVDVACAAASAPTLLVVWSYTHAACMQWLQQHVFTTHTLASALQPPQHRHRSTTTTRSSNNADKGASTLHERDSHTSSDGAAGWRNRLAALLDADPWLRLVQQYVRDVPPRRTRATAHGRLQLCPPLHKRATLLLVNVDRDVHAARRAYATLRHACGDWRSAEVHLLSLWAGEDGLASELATQFGVDALPHIAALHPAQRRLPSQQAQQQQQQTHVHATTTTVTACGSSNTSSNYSAVMLPPRIARAYRVTAPGDDDDVDDTTRRDAHGRAAVFLAPPPAATAHDSDATDDNNGDGDATIDALLLRGLSDEDGHWHTLPPSTRDALSRRVAALVAHSGAPLCFSARVCRRYVLVNPYARAPRKAVHSRCTSHVALRGWVTCADYAALRADVHTLVHNVRNAVVALRVVTPSAPLHTRLDAQTPLHRVRGLRHVVTCVVCQATLHVCTTPHYRCLQCTQASGVLCVRCAEVDDVAAAATHAAHHILLRLPAGSTRRRLPLLWGPSNVLPLPRFCNTLVTAAGGVHAGVHCARCAGAVVGRRWKCAVCYEHDLCDACAQWQHARERGDGDDAAAARAATLLACKALDKDAEHDDDSDNDSSHDDTACDMAVRHKQTTTTAAAAAAMAVSVDDVAASPRVHLLSHPLLCVRFAYDGDSDVFLRPVVVAPPYT